MKSFDYNTLLEVIKNNKDIWCLESRKKYWQDKNEVKKLIAGEYEKKGIPLPKGYESE